MKQKVVGDNSSTRLRHYRPPKHGKPCAVVRGDCRPQVQPHSLSRDALVSATGSREQPLPRSEIIFVCADSMLQRGKHGGKTKALYHKVDGVDVEWQPARTVEDSVLEDMEYLKVLPDDLQLELKMLAGKGLDKIHEQIKKWIDGYAEGDPKKFLHKLIIMTGKNDSIEKHKVGGQVVAKKGVSAHDAIIAQGLALLTVDATGVVTADIRNHVAFW